MSAPAWRQHDVLAAHHADVQRQPGLESSLRPGSHRSVHDFVGRHFHGAIDIAGSDATGAQQCHEQVGLVNGVAASSSYNSQCVGQSGSIRNQHTNTFHYQSQQRRFGVFLAVATYAGLSVLANSTELTQSPTTPNVTDALKRSGLHVFASFGRIIFPLVFLAGAAASAIQRSKRQSLLNAAAHPTNGKDAISAARRSGFLGLQHVAKMQTDPRH